MNKRFLTIQSLFGILLAACGSDSGEQVDGADSAADLTENEESSETTDSDELPETSDLGETSDAQELPDAPDDLEESSPDADVAIDVDNEIPIDAPITIPDAATHEVRTQERAIADESFLTEETSYFRTADQLPNLDVRVLQHVGSTLIAGTAGGVFAFDPDSQQFVSIETPGEGAVAALVSAGAQEFWVARGASAYRVSLAGEVMQTVNLASAITSLAVHESELWLGTESGVFDDAGNAAVELSAEFRALASTSAGVAAATEQGAFLLAGGVATLREPGDFYAVDACPDGTWLAGAEDKLMWFSGDSRQVFLPGPGALPTASIRSLDCSADWWLIGHEIGATALSPDGSHKDHYASGRWTLDTAVPAVALSADGSRWLAGASGVTNIRFVPRTLSESAALRQAELDQYFWRMDGFVGAEYNAPDVWTKDGGFVGDKDNDGLWTQMMIGAWAMAGAVTDDPQYCDNARKSMRNMLLLIDMPCITFSEAGLDCGFISRSIVRDDEGGVYDSKLTQSNWHRVTWGGHDYVWKDDTSSDEIAGHNFGFPMYFDHCATDEEKLEIAAKFGMLADYIEAGDFLLIDLDGERTTHGVWDATHITQCNRGPGGCDLATFDECVFSCYGGGFLNSMQILGTYLAAWHMTGEAKYYETYERLIRSGYDVPAQFSDNVLTATNTAIENHSDHELMMLAFHTLLRYEPNPERRLLWQESLRRMYATEIDERNPLWAAWVAGLNGEIQYIDESVQSLREFPLDQRTWSVDQSHRQDHILDPALDRFDEPQFLSVPPYDEIEAWWWNGNPKKVVQGGNAREHQGPMAFLIAYWSLRYYGVLQ